MGNWRTVHIIGTCDESEVAALRAALEPGEDYENFHCLCHTGALCGLPNWGMTEINVIGNLAERDYSINAVAKQLEEISKSAPSLRVKIHCGGDYESTGCINTVVLENGVATVLPPEVENIGAIPESQMAANLFDALLMSELKRKGVIQQQEGGNVEKTP